MQRARLISVSLCLLMPPHSLPRPLLDIVPRIRSPRSAHLVLGYRIFDLLDVDQFLYPHDLTGDRLCDGMVDGCHAFAETERLEYTLCLFRHANAGAHKRYPEIGHCVCDVKSG